MAVMGKIAWVDSNFRPAPLKALAPSSPAVRSAQTVAELFEFTSVFRGHELTRKERRIPSGLRSVDNLIEGGIVKGRISEIIAEPGAGKTSLAAAFAASVTRREAAAWIDASGDFDPVSIATAGVELTRLLWVSSQQPNLPPRTAKFPVIAASLKAAEWILAADGFGLVILDFGGSAAQLPQSAALRLARAAERSGAGVLVLAPRRICGTFAVLSLTLQRKRACFSRVRPGAPTLFGGLLLEACVTRNKLGGSGQTAKWKTVIEGDVGFSAGQDSLERLSHFNAQHHGLKPIPTGVRLAAANNP
jgi:RecA DNA recombination protein